MPNERRHVCTAAGHERLGREDTLVWPVRPDLLSNSSSISGAILLVVDRLRELSAVKDGDCPASRCYDSLNAPFAKIELKCWENKSINDQ